MDLVNNGLVERKEAYFKRRQVEIATRQRMATTRLPRHRGDAAAGEPQAKVPRQRRGE